jgi:hypothetical protein
MLLMPTKKHAKKKAYPKEPATKRPTPKTAAKRPTPKTAAKRATPKTATKKAVAPKKRRQPAASKKPAATASAKQDMSADGRKAIAPLFLVEPGPPHEHWTLCLSDNESPIELFEEEGHSGNGYAWDSVARIAMKKLGESVSRVVEFNSEAGTFVAQSERLETLLALGQALATMLREPESLRVAIRAVPADDWDD